MRDSQKTIKLVNELMGFYFKVGSHEMDVHVQDEKEEVIISIYAHIKDIPAERLDILDHLNTPRETQVEEYYWGLAGENNQYEELTLVGMMIDKANVKYEDEKLEITVFRKK